MTDPPSTAGRTPPAPRDEAVIVVCTDEQDELDVDVERWARLATAVVQELNPPPPVAGGHNELTLTFVDRTEITALNAEHRGVSGATDVLSFPLDADDTGRPPVGDVRLLGDVVVCPDVAARQANEDAGTVDDELALLVVHGILHVFGRDHDDDETTASMRAEERALLDRHHWHGAAPATFRQEHAG